MQASIGIVLLAAGIGTLIWIRNGAKRQMKERAWALLLLAAGTALAVCLQMRVPVPNPADAVSAVFAPIYKPIIGWIEEGK
ncbi:hypothetical protein KP806_26420 [Paenibacillus sp. N4]|uniref:hypothetical protein n=1 Tax=Paenibacillus vietnamensis TaxID=2590547 RepID=UPI001CD0D4A3|nr:hypothetical protein [Paenibacillus vietnamensis]MCA0758596.1 hypothetical protein [Paenibacillus vietnamensis]